MYHLTEKEMKKIMKSLLYENESEEYDATLDGYLCALHLKRHIIPGDGDCLFAAFRHNLSKIATFDVQQHLVNLGLSESPSVLDLRKVFVNHLLQKKKEYEMRFGEELNKEDINSYLKSGIYDTDIGDYVLPVLVDAIKISVTVVTPIADCPLLPFAPQYPARVEHMYLAFSAHRKHYDAVDQVTSDETHENDSTTQETVKPCACGRGEKRKADTPSCIAGEGYKSRCPCLAAGAPCLPDKCKCKKCENPFGHLKVKDIQLPPFKRVRKLQHSSKRLKSVDYMNEKDHALKQGSWTTEETVLLVQILKSHPKMQSNEMHKEFNDIAKACKPEQNIRIKTPKQFQSKLKYHQNQKKLVLDFIKKNKFVDKT
jgi:hypothetical protein